MASKGKTGKDKSAQGKGKATDPTGGAAAFKLLLIPFFGVYVLLAELFNIRSLEFFKRFMDAFGVSDYNLNMLFALIALIGMTLLIVFAPRRRFVCALAFLMLLLRGNESSEWIKVPAALIVAAACVMCRVRQVTALDPADFIAITAVSLCWGAITDLCCSGFSLQAALPPLIALGQRLLMDVSRTGGLYTGLGLGIVGFLVLLFMSPLRQRSIGGASACAAVALNSFLGLMWMNTL